jgi:uncharacterized integral membrane protein
MSILYLYSYFSQYGKSKYKWVKWIMLLLLIIIIMLLNVYNESDLLFSLDMFR